MLAFAVADGRLARNVATGVPLPRGAKVRREGQFLTLDELHAMVTAATGRYADVVTVLGPHDLRHTAASIWLGAGADPKVVQRVLGHASAAMTMDLYGHLIDRNLWEAADRVGGTTGARGPAADSGKAPSTGVERA